MNVIAPTHSTFSSRNYHWIEKLKNARNRICFLSQFPFSSLFEVLKWKNRQLQLSRAEHNDGVVQTEWRMLGKQSKFLWQIWEWIDNGPSRKQQWKQSSLWDLRERKVMRILAIWGSWVSRIISISRYFHPFTFLVPSHFGSRAMG